MRVLIAYDSVSGNTEKIAEILQESLRNLGMEVILRRAKEVTAEEIEESDALLIGTPTHNRSPTLQIRGLLKRMEGLKLSGKPGASFGSFGWSGEAPWLVRNAMKALKMNVMEESLRIKREPSEEDIEECRKFAEKFVEFVKN
ncbi:MAG: FprA family A-type flavoprotein [Archaeoglobi archaeon]|nr:FprA family A-type flavoprotein [Candidatus Mnemosynella sp.]